MRIDPVFLPAVHPGDLQEAFLRLFIAPGGHQLPRVVVIVPSRHRLALCDPFFINHQIPAIAAFAMLSRMPHDDVLPHDMAPNAHRLMHCALKSESRFPAHDALPVKDERRRSIRAHGADIGHHNRINTAVKRRLERHELFSFAAVKHIIRIHPHQIRLRRIGKRRIARVGKIIFPDIIEHLRRISARDGLRRVGRSRIQDHDLVDRRFHAVKTCRQTAFLIPDNHAKRYFHRSSPLSAANQAAHPCRFQHRVCQGAKKKFP